MENSNTDSRSLTRRNPFHRSFAFRWVLVLILGLTSRCSTPCLGALIVHDGFDLPLLIYATPEEAKLSGGTGWAGSWSGSRGAPQVQVLPAPLTHHNLATAGRSLYVNATVTPLRRTLNTKSRPDLIQSGRFGKDGSEVWFSALILPLGFGQTISLASSSGPALVIGYAAEDAPGATLGFGLFTSVNNQWLASTNNGVRLDRTTFLVVRIRSRAGVNDSADLWVNPLPGTVLGAPFASLTGFDLAFDQITLGRGQFDELRLGDSYADVAPTTLTPQASDANWDPRFGGVGPGFNVLAMASDGTNIVAGGAGIVGPLVSRYDGATWRDLSTGLKGGQVRALLMNGSELICGGSFFVHGKHIAQGLARWEKDHWEPIGEGVKFDATVDAGVNALVLHNGHIFAGGRFDAAGNSPARNVARWDGTAWKSVGIVPGGTTCVIRAMTSWNGYLYVGGRITPSPAGGDIGLARWDDFGWDLLGNGFRHADVTVAPSVEALAVWKDQLFVGGRFDDANAIQSANIVAYDGLTWSGLLGGLPREFDVPGTFGATAPGIVRTLLPTAKSLLVGGYFQGPASLSSPLITKWDGTAWLESGHDIPAPFNAIAQEWIVTSAATAGTNIVIGGTFPSTTALENARLAPSRSVNAAVLRGDYWVALRSSVGGETVTKGPGLERIKAIDAFDGGLAVCGDFQFAGSDESPGVGFWNGTRFQGLGKGLSMGVESVKAHKGELFAAGRFGIPGNANRVTSARWNGSVWTAIPVDHPRGLRLMAEFNGELYGTGNFVNTGIHRWRNNRWELIGIADRAINACIATTNGLYVGGTFQRITTISGEQISSAFLAKWDGKAWSAEGTQALSGLFTDGITCLAAAPDGHRFVVGGEFVASGNKPSLLAIWDGREFVSLLGTSDNPSSSTRISALCYQGKDLYVGGRFLDLNRQSFYHLARWDGVAWWPLGGGITLTGNCPDLDGCIQVDALFSHQGSVAVGGRFELIGRKFASGFALWTPPSMPSFPKLSVQDLTIDEAGGPNAGFRLELDRPTATAVRIFLRFEGLTAIAGTDFGTFQSTVTLPAGETHLAVTPRIIDDSLSEGDETFRLVLLGADNAILERSEAIATIRDDDIPGFSVSISIASGTGVEVAVKKSSASMRYVLQRKLDLSQAQWQPVASVVGTTGPISLSDPTPPPNGAFYRVVEENL